MFRLEFGKLLSLVYLEEFNEPVHQVQGREKRIPSSQVPREVAPMHEDQLVRGVK